MIVEPWRQLHKPDAAALPAAEGYYWLRFAYQMNGAWTHPAYYVWRLAFVAPDAESFVIRASMGSAHETAWETETEVVVAWRGPLERPG